MLHAEHGGGNNSTFTTHVVTSSGTDTYSCMAAALASLKGPRHGGANIKVVQMFEDLKASVKDWTDEDEIRAYLTGCLEGQRFDKSGLIYGMGHAVYSISDPRANLLRGFVEQLSEEKHMHEEYALYSAVERLAPQIISEKRKIYKGVSANVDFYRALFTACWACPPSCSPPSSPSPVWLAGAPTAWRNSSTWARSSARPTWRCSPIGSMCPWPSAAEPSPLPFDQNAKRPAPELPGRVLLFCFQPRPQARTMTCLGQTSTHWPQPVHLE